MDRALGQVTGTAFSVVAQMIPRPPGQCFALDTMGIGEHSIAQHAVPGRRCKWGAVCRVAGCSCCCGGTEGLTVCLGRGGAYSALVSDICMQGDSILRRLLEPSEAESELLCALAALVVLVTARTCAPPVTPLTEGLGCGCNESVPRSLHSCLYTCFFTHLPTRQLPRGHALVFAQGALLRLQHTSNGFVHRVIGPASASAPCEPRGCMSVSCRSICSVLLLVHRV